MNAATYVSETAPGVFTPVASRGKPLGSVNVYVTVIAPPLEIEAEFISDCQARTNEIHEGRVCVKRFVALRKVMSLGPGEGKCPG